MRLSIIVAVARNRVIGREGRLPWSLPADLRRFRSLTMGHHLLMGRRTFESIGRPLPGRTTVVITRDRGYSAEGVSVAHGLDDAVEIARRAGDDEAFVAGGAEIYREALARADRIYLTRVHGEVAGDTRFPEFDESAWHLVGREDREADDRNPYPLTFLVYQRGRVSA